MNTIPFNQNMPSVLPGRVMVVDDHRQARESMADVLRQAGHQVYRKPGMLQRSVAVPARRKHCGYWNARTSIAS